MFCNWIFPSSPKELKLKIKKKRNEHPPGCTQNCHHLKIFAGYGQKAKETRATAHKGDGEVSVQYIYIKYKI